MLWPFIVVAVVAQDPVLPSALPPLDEDLLQASTPEDSNDLSFFGQGRVMAGAVNRDVVGKAEPVAGAALSGRVGVSQSLEDLRAVVVVGDGAWWTAPLPAPQLLLVQRPWVAPLQQVSLEVPVGLFDAPSLLLLGRFPLTVADGRLVGSEPFDARGRSVDGAVVDVELLGVVARGGAVLLDLGAAASVEALDWSGLAFLSGRGDVGSTGFVVPALWIDAYAFLHRDGAEQTIRPTLGARAQTELVGVRWSAGLDGQFALNEASLESIDQGVHADVSAHTLLPWTLAAPRPFVEVGLEGTGGLVAPAPTTHGTLGSLDLVALTNTWQVRAALGVDSENGLLVSASWRLVGGLGVVHDPAGVVVVDAAGPLFSEVDVDLSLPLGSDVAVDVAWAVAVGRGALPSGPAQRLIAGLRFSFGDDARLPF